MAAAKTFRAVTADDQAKIVQQCASLPPNTKIKVVWDDKSTQTTSTTAGEFDDVFD